MKSENSCSILDRHPEQTPSEVTILVLDESLFNDEGKDIDTIIKDKYNEEERKLIIVDRSKGKIIDSRTSNMDQNINKDKIKPLKMMTRATLGCPWRGSEDEYIVEKIEGADSKIIEMKKDWRNSTQYEQERGDMFKSLWEDNWKEVDKVHQQFLQAIVKNNPIAFLNILQKKNTTTPIDVNYRYQSNWTPLHYAAMSPTVQILSRLINHPRVDINALTDFGDTPLHIAAKSNKLQNTLLLLSAGVCIDKRDDDSCTALHYACELGYRNIAEALIQQGACYQLKNSNGMTAVDLTSNQMRDIFPDVKASQIQDFNPLYRNRHTNHKAMIEKMLNAPGTGNSLVVPPPKQKGAKSKDKQEEKIQKLTSRQKNIYKMYQFIKEHHRMETITLSNFKFYKRIGEGAFGEVYLVKKDGKNKFYAMKAIRKQRVFGTNLYRYIQTEKDILSLLNHPFIVKLRYAFQTQTYLFLVMDFCQGGDLSKLLEKRKKFEERFVKNYACEILLGVEALHKNNILYRDLKPENIVLDKQGHALLTDFGLSKKSQNLDDLNKSFCGTPAYLPLEIINKKGHNRMADWYQFGVVLYQLYTGFPPFYADTKAELYDLVRAGVIRFPKNTPETFRDLIKKLLNQNPDRRLGVQKDAESIKEHPWFNDVDWDEVIERKLMMPPIDFRLKIGDPIKTKFHDVKSEKYQIPMWSFIS